MKFLFIFITLITALQLSAQSLNGIWLFNNDEYFLIINQNNTRSESFDYIKGHTLTGDTLTLNHIYDQNTECYSYENGKPVKIDCPDNSIPDSKFLITKQSEDSLFISPVNRSGIAISARLKIRHFEQSRRIIEDPNYEPDYFKTIKLYNAQTLYENINWESISLSHTTQGYWGKYYFDIQIQKNGKVNAKYHYEPFEEGKPTRDQKVETIFYDDFLTTHELDSIQTLLNQSGINYTDLPRKGFSSHGRLIRLNLDSNRKSRTLEAYEYVYPSMLRALVKHLSDYVRNEFEQTNKEISISTSFLNEWN